MFFLDFLFDPEVVYQIIEFIPVWIGYLLLFTSYLGSIYVIIPVSFLRYLYSSLKDKYWVPILMVGYASFSLLKPIISITRPNIGFFDPEQIPYFLFMFYEGAVGFTSGSFPSGHAVATTIFTILIILDTDLLRKSSRFLLGILYVLVVGFSRIALGIHYPGDIIGGILIGGVISISLLWVRDGMRYSLDIITLIGFFISIPVLFVDFLFGILLVLGFTFYYLVHSIISLSISGVDKPFLIEKLF